MREEERGNLPFLRIFMKIRDEDDLFLAYILGSYSGFMESSACIKNLPSWFTTMEDTFVL